MLSAVILTKNEEKNIRRCLENLSFCNQIVVIDDYSSDGTIDIAKKFKVEVFQKKLNSFSEQRNFGLSKAKNKWVLFIDADEIVSKDLKDEIEKRILDDKFNGYFIQRKDKFLNHDMKYGDLGNVWLMRLVKKDKAKWVNDVHEICVVNGKTSKLKNFLFHTSHESLSEFVEKINKYSSLRAKELSKYNTNSSFISILFFPAGKFLYLFIIKVGFMDGIYGLVHALFMSMYSFLVRGKLYQLNKNDK